MLMIGNGESLVVAGQSLKFEGFALHCATPATAAWQCIADGVNGLLHPIPFPISVSIRFSRMMNKRMMNKRIRVKQSWVRAGIFFLLTASLSFGGIDMLKLSQAKPGASVSGMSDMTAEVGQDPSWKIIEMGDNKGVRYCENEGKEGVLYFRDRHFSGDFTFQGRVLFPAGGLQQYGGWVFGSTGPGAGGHDQWRFYFADGGVLQSGFGKIIGRLAPLEPDRWYSFRQIRQGKSVKIYLSPSAKIDESNLVLEGELPPLNPGDGHDMIGLFGVNGGPVFADLMFVTPPGESDKKTFSVTTGAYQIGINLETGWPVSFVDESPTRVSVLDKDRPFVLSIKRKPGGRAILLDKVVSTVSNGTSLEFCVAPSDPEWAETAKATIRYEFGTDQVNLSANVTVLKDVKGEHEVRFGFGTVPENWNRQFYTTVPENIFRFDGGGFVKEDPRAERRLSANGEVKNIFVGRLPETDVQKKNSNDWASFLPSPLCVLERPDRLLAFASFDTGSPILFSLEPVGSPSTYPTILRFPKDLTAGATFNFQLSWKSFLRPQNSYAQVMDWFSNHAYSSNPSTKDAVGRATATLPPRSIPGLLNGWGPTALKGDPQKTVTREKEMVEEGTTMTWWISSHSLMGEVMPLDEQPYFDEAQIPRTPAEIKAELARQMNAGLHPIMYRRSWLIWESLTDTSIPGKSWVKQKTYRGPGGPLELDIPELAHEIPNLAPEVAAKVGHKVIHKLQSDMNNPVVQKWWIDQVMKELKAYLPSGQWWDMVDSGQEGILGAMKVVRDRAAVEFPWMRFVSNEAMFSLSSLHSDAFAIESFEVGGKTERSFEAAKAWGRPFFSLIYSVYFQGADYPLGKANRPSDSVRVDDVSYFAIRYRMPVLAKSDQSDPSTPVVSARQLSWRDGPKIPLVKMSDLIEDGEWHTHVVPLVGILGKAGKRGALAIGAASDGGYQEALPGENQITALFVDLPAKPGIKLEVDAWGFYKQAPTEGQLQQPDVSGSWMAYDDFSGRNFWPARSPAITPEGTAVFEPGPNSEDLTWMKTDLRPFYRGLARALSLGGWPGLGPAEPHLPLLYPIMNFSSSGLNLTPVMEPLAAVSDAPVVSVSVWSGISRAQLAAYNASAAKVPLSIVVDEALLSDRYGFSGTFANTVMQLFDTENESGLMNGTFKTEPAGPGKVKITGGVLRPYELLMVQSR